MEYSICHQNETQQNNLPAFCIPEEKDIWQCFFFLAWIPTEIKTFFEIIISL